MVCVCDITVHKNGVLSYLNYSLSSLLYVYIQEDVKQQKAFPVRRLSCQSLYRKYKKHPCVMTFTSIDRALRY